MDNPTIKQEQSGACSGYAERRGGRNGVNLCKSDLLKIISYLDDAAKLYDALPMQSLKSRAHMIKQLTKKTKIKNQ